MMNDKKKIEDGGNAFPTVLQHPEIEGVYAYLPGMTLRDWFAGMAIQGLMINNCVNCESSAYAVADKMIAERSKI